MGPPLPRAPTRMRWVEPAAQTRPYPAAPATATRAHTSSAATATPPHCPPPTPWPSCPTPDTPTPAPDTAPSVPDPSPPRLPCRCSEQKVLSFRFWRIDGLAERLRHTGMRTSRTCTTDTSIERSCPPRRGAPACSSSTACVGAIANRFRPGAQVPGLGLHLERMTSQRIDVCQASVLGAAPVAQRARWFTRLDNSLALSLRSL